MMMKKKNSSFPITKFSHSVHTFFFYNFIAKFFIQYVSSLSLSRLQVMISFKIDKQLQTISNYFLLSLAIADLAIGLVSMPLFTVQTIAGYWPFGSFICDTWLSLDYLASNASVLNLLIISFDRYFSVTRPLTYRAKRTNRKAAIMISLAWLISLILWPPWIYSWPYIEGNLQKICLHRVDKALIFIFFFENFLLLNLKFQFVIFEI